MTPRPGGLALATFLGLGFGACFDSGSGADCPKGSLSCACSAEGECETGLMCIDNVCRNPGSGTDGTDGTGSATDTTDPSTSTTDPGSTSSLTLTTGANTSGVSGTGGMTTETSSTGAETGSTGGTGSCVTLRFGENMGDDVKGVTADAFASELVPDDNAGSESELEIDGSTGDTETTFIRFDLTAIPTTATVQNGRLRVTTNGTMGSESLPGEEFHVYVATETWAESELTWTNRLTGTPWSSAGCASAPCRGTDLGFFEPAAQNMLYDIVIDPAVIQAWVDGSVENNGFTIGTTAGNGADLHSSESQDMTSRPVLEVHYCD